jgi:hypothetical protein
MLIFEVLFGHVMSKACQYVDVDAKVCHVFAKVSLKGVQSSLQKNNMD